MVRVLILDTCGENSSVALADDGAVLVAEKLPARGSSSHLLPAVARLLEAQGWKLASLDGVGVVSGPGSFTGVRVGLSVAKGLCSAAGVKLVTVSRLEVLVVAAALQSGWAVLDAGRGEFYVRAAATNEERLYTAVMLKDIADGTSVVVTEAKLLQSLARLSPQLVAVDAGSALPLVLRELALGGSDVALADANYVRGEREIYAKPPIVDGQRA